MKPEIIFTKQDIQWHLINEYLEAISNICITQNDKAFNKLLKNMQNYVNDKLTIENDDDVIDSFVLVLQQSKK